MDASLFDGVSVTPCPAPPLPDAPSTPAVRWVDINLADATDGGADTLLASLPPGALDEIRSFVALMKKRLPEYAALCNANPIFKARLENVGHLDLEGCMALGLTGPVLRSTGYGFDLRKAQPYCGYETYDFDVQT